LALIERLMPDAYAISCWPSEGHLGLVHSQQLAVNTILSTFASGQGLLGINGPPGTGKTTLLRDLIAAIIASRADELAKLRRASDVFLHNGREAANDGSKQQISFRLNPVLYGFEIVVASSNNGAVENVTLELPQRNKIDESWLPEAEYFAELGELITGKPAWGLIAGALGSKARRTRFVDRYFYGQRPFGSEDKGDSEAAEDADVESDEEIKDAVDAQLSGPSTMEESDDGNDNHDNAPPQKEKEPQGFLGWLTAQAKINATRSPEQRQVLWQQAVSDYEVVKEEARKACADASRIRELIQAICQTRKMIVDRSETFCTLEQKLTNAVAQLVHLDAKESGPANMALKQCLGRLKQHQSHKPGFWEKLFSLWRVQRDWKATLELLEGERDLASAEFTRSSLLQSCTRICRNPRAFPGIDPAYEADFY
jgi:hypothetical protein